jgi:CDGSH-type Zn-finger protein
MSKPKITAFENGPFLIQNIEKLVNSKGEKLECTSETYLCRCGGSADKPYCDKTHETNGFNSQNEEKDLHNKTIEYKGKEITIFDNRNICSHRGYCSGELPIVFTDGKPWINPDGASVEEIIAICDKCPSGALSYALHGSKRNQGAKDEIPTVRLAERHFGYHGPYDVSGEIELDSPGSRSPESPVKTTLCRCGHSKNKPFCDGEHYNHQFEDEKNE